jgi:hypothetical protein
VSKVYLIGALKNERIIALANLIEARGHEVFADWFSPGPDADVYWQKYEVARGRTFLQAIKGPHAKLICTYDYRWLQWCDVGVMVCPAGKSAHLELGYLRGSGKHGYILLHGEPARWDIMYGLATGIFDDFNQLLEVL